jgi:hypothetical protein
MALLHKLPFDWKQRAVLQGRGFHIDIGAFSTPIVGDTTIIDLDRPIAAVAVPSGTSIFPIRVHAQCQTPLLATDADEAEILLGVDITAANNFAETTHTNETALKMYLGHSVSSSCDCISAQTADMTVAPIIGMELARSVITGDINGTAANALWGKLELLYEPKALPLLVGPCTMYLYWGGTVQVSGFAQIQWLEYLSAEI